MTRLDPNDPRVREELNALLNRHPRAVPDVRQLLMGPRPAPTASGILTDARGRRYRVTIERIDPRGAPTR